ncbi:flavin reductase family protein [Pusillimonas noertemannii]|uniref:Flavin reductase (DIM6/NTAB) family NADH-FMN oxidoreductase RutF n=1 Tax=Pusillimonas noertemannii TaxID=305977 RepID=A0A2U1CH15_9BURK|nr:flavin reductase family protein [Pusillimonas noertemannii]NYT68226.1 flavin reductase family protein [Pusillimonas noertemannii]PVY60196.1 flavin reductase (DIM6/NTAB) family NADH-FMN oxidoreductase RutF [Pusillimonas noertemannii]TFL10307.1 flavin reductase [Pusillimonas noertemannii]
MLQAQTAMPRPIAAPKAQPKPELRHAFGRFATGIAVITTLDDDGRPYGLTVNSFASVSMAPPMISWNVIRGSTAHATIARAGRFVVNVLATHQRDIAQKMTGPIEHRFAGVPYHASSSGLPVIGDTLATFECETHSMITAGDHDIVLGTVKQFEHRDGRPLVYWRGGYATAMACDADHQNTAVRST